MSGGASPLTVVFVEDDKELADLYETWLADDYEVRTAHSGEAALEEIEGADVVFLDRQLPGMSGLEVLDYINEHDYPCQVSMLSAMEPDFEDTFGYDMYLTKPVEQEALHETVKFLADTPPTNT